MLIFDLRPAQSSSSIRILTGELRTESSVLTYIFDDRLPTPLIIDHIPISRRVNDVQTKSNAILHDHLVDHAHTSTLSRRLNLRCGRTVRLRMDLGRRPRTVVWLGPSFRVHKVGCEEGIYEGGLAKTGLTYKRYRSSAPSKAHITEDPATSHCQDCSGYREPNVPTTMTLNWKPRLRSLCSIWRVIATKILL